MVYMVTYGQDYVFSWQIHELLEVEIVVQVLIDGLQFLQHTTVRVATEVLDGHFAAYINFKNTIIIWIYKIVCLLLRATLPIKCVWRIEANILTPSSGMNCIKLKCQWCDSATEKTPPCVFI